MSLAPIPRHHVGNVGTVFRRELVDNDGDPLDLTDLDTATFRFLKPADGGNPSITVDELGTVVGAAANGVVEYTTVAGLIDRPGRWQLQVIVAFTGGETFAATAYEFKVHEVLPTPAP